MKPYPTQEHNQKWPAPWMATHLKGMGVVGWVQVGWPRRPPQKVEAALKNSYMVASLYLHTAATPTGATSILGGSDTMRGPFGRF